jgi:hypothetical protein
MILSDEIKKRSLSIMIENYTSFPVAKMTADWINKNLQVEESEFKSVLEHILSTRVGLDHIVDDISRKIEVFRFLQSGKEFDTFVNSGIRAVLSAYYISSSSFDNNQLIELFDQYKI